MVGCKRIGKVTKNSTKPRPLLLELKSESDKYKIFGKVRNLRNTEFNGVFITPDQTRFQLSEGKRLRDKKRSESLIPANATSELIVRNGKLLKDDIIIDQEDYSNFC